MQHMGRKHGGQQLLSESVGQVRRLDRAACVVCGTTVQPMRLLQKQYPTP